MKLRQMREALIAPLVSVGVGLLIGMAVMAASGTNPILGMKVLFAGGYGSVYKLFTTLSRATPILFAALASSLAWGSGYSSMGMAGQMTIGAITAAVTAVSCPGPAWFVLLVSILAGMIGGALYSLISAFAYERFQISLLITTLMMNYIADNAASYLTNYVFKDPKGSDQSAVQTQLIEKAVLPRVIDRYALHAGLFIAFGAVFLILFLMKRTAFGYKAKMNGLNSAFARFGGIDHVKMLYLTLLLSGAVAGLGGAGEVLGTRYRYVDLMITSPGYAWSGITASLMASNHPLGCLAASVFLAGLTVGGQSLELQLGVAQEVVQIIQGVITLLVTARLLQKMARKKKAETEKGGA